MRITVCAKGECTKYKVNAEKENQFVQEIEQKAKGNVSKKQSKSNCWISFGKRKYLQRDNQTFKEVRGKLFQSNLAQIISSPENSASSSDEDGSEAKEWQTVTRGRGYRKVRLHSQFHPQPSQGSSSSSSSSNYYAPLFRVQENKQKFSGNDLEEGGKFKTKKKKKGKQKQTKGESGPGIHKIASECTLEISRIALEAIAKYCLDQDQKSSKRNYNKTEIAKHALLVLVSIGSLWLYAITGANYAGCKSIKLDSKNCNKGLGIRLIIGSCAINFVVTYNTSEQFLNSLRSIPVELKSYFPKKGFRKDTLVIGTGAFFSAVPLALAALGKIKNINGLAIAGAAITQIVNTFIHTLPVMIIVRHPALRNIIPYYFSMLLASRNPGKRLALFREIGKARSQQAIVELFISRIEETREFIFSQTKEFNWCKIQWEFKLPKELKREDNESGLEYLIFLLSNTPVKNVTKSAYKIVLSTLNSMVNWVFYLGFAVFVNTGVAGYFIGNYDDMDNATDNSYAAWALSSPTNFVLVVMIGYFAGRFGRDVVWKGFKEIFSGGFKMPQAWQRYPKTLTAILGIFLYFAWNSRGTALYLLKENSDNLVVKNFHELLEGTAYAGSLIFNFKNALEWFLDKALIIAQSFGDEDTKACARLDAELGKIAELIRQLPSETVVRELKKLSDEAIYATLGVTAEHFEQMCREVEDCERKFGGRWDFFVPKKQAVSETTGLLGRHASVDYTIQEQQQASCGT